MISLIKVIVEYFSKLLSKRGELRYGYILPAPKLSSSYRVLKYLSSCVLLLKFRLKSYSDLFRVSMDPRVKPEGDGRECVLEGDGRESVSEGDGRESVSEGDGRESVSEGDNSLLSSLRAVTRGQAIFELDKNLTPLNFLLVKRRVVRIVVLFLFLLFPFSSHSAVYFLPDAQWDAPMNVSIDSSQCEDAGYTYYPSGVCPPYHNQDTCVFMDKYLKCDGRAWCMDNGYTISSCPNPKLLTTKCPNNTALYKSCVCPTTYIYACTGTGYGGGSGVVCDGKYTSCACATNYVWSGGKCVCDGAFKYSCSGTGYSSGSGVSCGGKFKSCNCSTYYSWNGSACAHVHSYVCPSGYSTSNSGMVEPTSTSKVCQLSGCSSKSGTCYKETHVHSYACASGYSTSCSNGYSASSAKTCSHSKCSASSGTCYKCCAATYKYTCNGTGYKSGVGTACSGKYTSCTCADGYHWTGSACVAHSYSCPSGYSASSSGMITPASTSKVCSCGAKSGTCYKETHTHSYSCPSGYSTSSSGMITPASASKVCSCGTKSGTCYKETHTHSYACTSGYSASCTNGYSGTASKKCSCGATSGTCYACCAATYKYTCSGTGYSSGSGTACNSKYTACTCAKWYYWTGSSCAVCPVGSYYASNDTCSPTKMNAAIGVVVKEKTYVMSLFQGVISGVSWGASTTNYSQIPDMTTETKAKADMNGKTYTSILASSQGNGQTWAASNCTNATWGNRKWYLPSLGELVFVVNNIKTIKEIYSGETLGPTWSSSEYDKKEAWMVNFGVADIYDPYFTDLKYEKKDSWCFLDTSS